MSDADIILMCICTMYIGRQTDQPPPSIVDILTGICWDEEDAGRIKRLLIESMVELEAEQNPEQFLKQIFGGENDNKT